MSNWALRPSTSTFAPLSPIAVLEGLVNASVSNIDRIGQTAESLVAHSVKQLVLHPLIRPGAEPLEDQEAHHRLSQSDTANDRLEG